ncbi:MAG TPA: IS5 family transposase [Gammaproteobacteria bacterium]|nr:IS5 family transposase [Gammaproteobacteria bacterium]
MRGEDLNQSPMFSYVSPEERVPSDHPLRAIRGLIDAALLEMSADLAALYPGIGRPSIAPEKLLRALLLQIFYSVRSERMLMEQLNYNLLFRWFVGLNMDEPVWDATVFSKNRERLLEGEVAQAFFAQVVKQSQAQGLLSSEHFTVDGTLLEAWAGIKSFQKKAEPPEKGSGTRGQKLLRDTHASTTDPEAHLYRKSRQDAFRLSYLGHVLMENRSGLPVGACVTPASPQGEWEAAVALAAAQNQGKRRITLGADKGYDEGGLLERLRQLHVTPHIQRRESATRRSHLDARTTRHPGYQSSILNRKRIEPIFGWLKTTALVRKLRHRGCALVDWMFVLAVSGYHLVRLARLTAQPA